MTKREAFDELWIKCDYCMMGYNYETLYKSMKKDEVISRLREAESEKWADKNSRRSFR